MKKKAIALVAAVAALGFTPAVANDYAEQLASFAEDARAWATDPAVIAAIKAQNVTTADYDQEEIDALDQDWRAQVGASDAPLINEVAAHDVSGYLAEQRDASEGLITEIFVMDRVGLNVAMSDTTSDYWQGDEAKFLETFGVGADAVHISEVELDESTQTYQSQVSFALVDPENGDVIGAVTIGVDVGYLE